MFFATRGNVFNQLGRLGLILISALTKLGKVAKYSSTRLVRLPLRLFLIAAKSSLGISLALKLTGTVAFPAPSNWLSLRSTSLDSDNWKSSGILALMVFCKSKLSSVFE